MDMAITGCWNCPTPILRALLQAAIALATLGFSVRLGSAKHLLFRLLGMAAVGIALLGYALLTFGFIRNGISWREGLYSSLAGQLAILLPWFSATAAVLFRLQQRVRPRRPTSQVSGV